ncbi:rho GTPase-activating protein 7-like isoform X3 [Artemia franciscana]|uniref:rho GTPase-activating protein 7-like isoform X3 n=1 Tax=Artemia franciscana TaxID=6661 RepID=UPI0032DA5B7A
MSVLSRNSIDSSKICDEADPYKEFEIYLQRAQAEMLNLLERSSEAKPVNEKREPPRPPKRHGLKPTYGFNGKTSPEAFRKRRVKERSMSLDEGPKTDSCTRQRVPFFVKTRRTSCPVLSHGQSFNESAYRNSSEILDWLSKAMAEFHDIVDQELCDLRKSSLSPWARFHIKVLDSISLSRESIALRSPDEPSEETTPKLQSDKNSVVPVPAPRKMKPKNPQDPQDVAAFIQRVEKSIRRSNAHLNLADNIVLLQELVNSLNDVDNGCNQDCDLSDNDHSEENLKSVMTQTTPLSLSRESSEDDNGSNNSLQRSVDSNPSAVESGIGTNSPPCLLGNKNVVSDSSDDNSDDVQWKSVRRRHSGKRMSGRRREAWHKVEEPIVTHKPPPHKVAPIILQSFSPSPASSSCPIDSGGSGGSACNTLDSVKDDDDKFGEKIMSASAPALKSTLMVPPLAAYVDKGSISAATTPSDGNKTFKESIVNARSSSATTLAEIEASEACRWLRAAGFPQYAQMYEDSMFPLDLSGARADHHFLDVESLSALFRRLEILNRASKLKLESGTRKKLIADSDEEENSCAISSQWTYQRQSRRWSRISPIDLSSDLTNEYCPNELISPIPEQKRSSSERLREGARSWLKRMESFRSRSLRRKSQRSFKASDIGTPRIVDLVGMDEKLKTLNCVTLELPSANIKPGSPNANDSGLDSPDLSRRLSSRKSRRSSRSKRESGSVSDSECQKFDYVNNDPNTNTKDSFLIGYYDDDLDGGRRKMSYQGEISQGNRLRLTLDLNNGHRQNGSEYLTSGTPDAIDGRIGKWSPIIIRNSNFDIFRARKVSCGSSQNRDLPSNGERKNSKDLDLSERGSDLQSQGSSGSIGVHCDSDLDGSLQLGRDSGRWQGNTCESYPSTPDNIQQEATVPIVSLTVGQMILVRKVALLRLTGIMEAHVPNHKGLSWAWDIPKFLKKIRPPEHRGKGIFGAPLYLNVQKWGTPVPPVILAAFKFLRREAMDQVGLFRKPGVKSRISSLRRECDSGREIEFDAQQAFDVADLVKQYFRDLPEALLTSKLSETFVAIFQALPHYLRLEATRYALLLLPDEHREALNLLLSFLIDISSMSSTNQMTLSNLAVCFAPSLFQLSHTISPRSTSSSPRRRTKTTGTPDPRELGENKAAHDCMLTMLREYNQLFQLTQEFLANCPFSYLDESVPVSLAELRTEKALGWKAYHDACFAALLREAKEKSKGWVSTSYPDPTVELTYKKVGDGHALRMWRAGLHIPAPPSEILSRLLYQRHLFDGNAAAWRMIEKLDSDSDVTQFVSTGLDLQEINQTCLLRSWRTNLFGGGSALVETSIEHNEARIIPAAIPRIVLASRYLIEPAGSGHSKITYLSRIDLRGRTPEWYNKVYGHLIVQDLENLRASFVIAEVLPETTL